MISLKTYNKKDLETLINSEEFASFPFLPISKHRAISQINNPRSTDEDILLILAFDGDELAGYLGILPDYIFVEHKKMNCAWLSTLFIHPKNRGKKIAQKLLSKAAELYGGKIFMTEFTSEAESLYLKTGDYTYLKPLEGYAHYFLANLAKILPSKNEKWTKYKPFLKSADFFLNLLSKPLYWNVKSNKPEVANHKIDEEISDFITKNNMNGTFKRGLPELNWIVDYRWLLESKNKDSKYLFSSFSTSFKNQFLKVYNSEGKLESVIFLTIREGTAKLQFVFGENLNHKKITDHLYQHLIKNKITHFICYDEKINEFFLTKKSLYKKKRQRKFLIHKNFLNKLDSDFDFKVFGGDSDAVFT